MTDFTVKRAAWVIMIAIALCGTILLDGCAGAISFAPPNHQHDSLLDAQAQQWQARQR